VEKISSPVTDALEYDLAGYMVALEIEGMAELPEHEERAIRDYVNSQSPNDDQAEVVQKVGSHRILGRVREIYDVHCKSTRWWVITDPTNLYLQTDFPQAKQALIFHIGLGIFIYERSRAEIDDDHEEHVSAAWRRFRDALDAMNSAAESEDFQAVGIKCRDALIALVRTHRDASWVGEVSDPPKASDFKGWANIFADRLSNGRLRTYLKTLVERTWDLAVWLQHFGNATPIDADIVLESTSHLITVFGKLIHRLEVGEPERCPRCESYRLDVDVRHDESRKGFFESTVCASCGWESEPAFTSWAEHFADADIEGYLSGPGLGFSDRLNRGSPRAD